MHKLLVALWSTLLVYMLLPIYALSEDVSLLRDYWIVYTAFGMLTGLVAWLTYRERRRSAAMKSENRKT